MPRGARRQVQGGSRLLGGRRTGSRLPHPPFRPAAWETTRENKKHRDADPEPIEVHVWYEEHYKYSIAHVIYEGEEYSVPASLAYELSGAVFDGMTLMTGVIDVQ